MNSKGYGTCETEWWFRWRFAPEWSSPSFSSRACQRRAHPELLRSHQPRDTRGIPEPVPGWVESVGCALRGAVRGLLSHDDMPSRRRRSVVWDCHFAHRLAPSHRIRWPPSTITASFSDPRNRPAKFTHPLAAGANRKRKVAARKKTLGRLLSAPVARRSLPRPHGGPPKLGQHASSSSFTASGVWRSSRPLPGAVTPRCRNRALDHPASDVHRAETRPHEQPSADSRRWRLGPFTAVQLAASGSGNESWRWLPRPRGSGAEHR